LEKGGECQFDNSTPASNINPRHGVRWRLSGKTGNAKMHPIMEGCERGFWSEEKGPTNSDSLQGGNRGGINDADRKFVVKRVRREMPRKPKKKEAKGRCRLKGRICSRGVHWPSSRKENFLLEAITQFVREGTQMMLTNFNHDGKGMSG